MTTSSKKISLSTYLIIAFLLLPPVFVNGWKFIVRDYTLYEIWAHLVLDLFVLILFVFLIAKNPLESPLIYYSLFIAFSISYLVVNTPSSILEWVANALVLGAFGVFIFPRLSGIFPIVAVGLFLSYYGVIRYMLPEMNYDEAQEVLQKKNASETAKEFIHILANYERNMLGREKYRYLLMKDERYTERLKKAAKLHASLFPALQKSGISFLMWQEANIKVENDLITVFGRLPGVANDGSGKNTFAEVEPVQIRITRLPDDTYRILDFPEEIHFKKVE